jgi:hypothetical protein
VSKATLRSSLFLNQSSQDKTTFQDGRELILELDCRPLYFPVVHDSGQITYLVNPFVAPP